MFIDELDAVGARRGAGMNEERDQTLNQLLTELDGFEGRAGILLLAATNRPEARAGPLPCWQSGNAWGGALLADADPTIRVCRRGSRGFGCGCVGAGMLERHGLFACLQGSRYPCPCPRAQASRGARARRCWTLR